MALDEVGVRGVLERRQLQAELVNELSDKMVRI